MQHKDLEKVLLKCSIIKKSLEGYALLRGWESRAQCSTPQSVGVVLLKENSSCCLEKMMRISRQSYGGVVF